MNSILFVDDEKNILNGLRRRLRSARPDWQTSFASSGQEALSFCDEKIFDVVVTDMRMPGMDGAELLEKIKKISPNTARIILSGFSEKEAVLRTVGPAHQYLAKPCDDEILIETIHRILAMRQLLAKPEIYTLIGNVDSLSSPPDTYSRLVDALDDPKAGNDRIVAIVSSDIALTAEILKLTNSAYFSLPAKVTSISHAVRMIGTETLKSLTLFVGLFKSFDGPASVRRQIITLCQRSQQIGIAAALIAEHEGFDRNTCAQLPSIGMLSHIGSLVLYLHHYKEMAQVIQRVEQENISIIEAEQDQFGAAHPEIGAYLLGLWGFSELIVQTVALHHQPPVLPVSSMTLLSALYAAQHLAREIALHDSGAEGGEDDLPTTLDMAYMESIGKSDKVAAWRKIVATVLARSEKTDRRDAEIL
jgi:HD-like signal output (HDOD) protein/CheY-like chemotaxis protein|tara:strand:- start:1230 stop:2483 length:1254 start_codon:yes stop_codon:yes gene_type:complete